MATYLPVRDYTKPTWQNDKLAYIDCKAAHSIQGRQIGVWDGYVDNNEHDGETPQGGYQCSNAVFHVNRTLIKLPSLNVFADNIYSRIIPAPGGDCKLLSDASNQVKIPYMDISITGRPVGIACNVSLDNTINIDPGQNLHDTNGTSGKDSTNTAQGTKFVWDSSTDSALQSNASASNSNPTKPGQIQYTPNSPDGAYRTVPPPTDFLRYNNTNSVCFSGPSEYLCLPPGTYQTSTGKYGFDSRKATGLAMPSGAQVNLTWMSAGYSTGHGPGNADMPTRQGNIYKTPISDGSSNQKSFKSDIQGLAGSSTKTFTVECPHSLPGACVFSGTNYQGDVQCFGLGGTSLPSYISTTAQSISLVGEVEIYIFSGKYGDTTEQWIQNSTSDLNGVHDGSELTFANRLAAMWVTLPVDPFKGSQNSSSTSRQNTETAGTQTTVESTSRSTYVPALNTSLQTSTTKQSTATAVTQTTTGSDSRGTGVPAHNASSSASPTWMKSPLNATRISPSGTRDDMNSTRNNLTFADPKFVIFDEYYAFSLSKAQAFAAALGSVCHFNSSSSAMSNGTANATHASRELPRAILSPLS